MDAGRRTLTSLSLKDDDDPRPVRDPERRGGRGLWVLLLLLLLLLGGVGFFAYKMWLRSVESERQLALVVAKAEEAATLARQAAERSAAAETSARAAAEGRQVAEAQTADARKEADSARQEATSATEAAATAKEEAARAQAEAESIRKRAASEVNRLEAALGQIAETRRTALGLVMNLGSDHLKFEFNKADLRPSDRELLARVAGILVTSHDFTISVNGHTDDVGSDAYNQKLSERRAQAVRDYLVKSGLPENILTVEGHGKSLPLVKGTSEAARAKNRRVELGIVNTQIRYGH
jgi:outer membrane protein OmpA-like peptidoglycan-associated protein